jgi:D-serine deaminase-like pyridoxal phosphate-dependent protein
VPQPERERTGEDCRLAQPRDLAWLGEEHAIVELATGDALELGQQVHIVPNHGCAVVNLADELVVHGDGVEATSWRVDAR